MPDGRISKDLLYGELATGKRAPHLRFRDVCKRDLESVDINVEGWEELASDCAGGDRKCVLVSPDRGPSRDRLPKTDVLGGSIADKKHPKAPP